MDGSWRLPRRLTSRIRCCSRHVPQSGRHGGGERLGHWNGPLGWLRRPGKHQVKKSVYNAICSASDLCRPGQTSYLLFDPLKSVSKSPPLMFCCQGGLGDPSAERDGGQRRRKDWNRRIHRHALHSGHFLSNIVVKHTSHFYFYG